MRHRKSGLKLNRNSSNRKALFRNLAIALIDHKVIKTTLPKARELRCFVEPLVTLSKEDSLANRRLAFSCLNSKQAVGQLFSELAIQSKNRPGGYTRIIKAGYRAGDNAPMAYIEFVDRHNLAESPSIETESDKKPTEAVEAAKKKAETTKGAKKTEKAQKHERVSMQPEASVDPATSASAEKAEEPEQANEHPEVAVDPKAESETTPSDEAGETKKD